MARLIQKRMQPQWNPRGDAPDASSIIEWLGDYTKRIDTSLLPSPPNRSDDPHRAGSTLSWRGLILARIDDSGDSCAGPDGIPFAALRLFRNIVADFVLDILIDLSNGADPAKDFNLGRLFMIPKDDSFADDRLRPITVANTVNRMVGGGIVDAITPLLQAFIEDSQQGFLKGRNGEVHIGDLNDFYYRNLDKKQTAFILLLDTAKAFDSIDHLYIMVTLRSIGMPPWVLNLVAALLHDAMAIIALPGSRIRLYIGRGVKQGCPLSPILFIIAYDPLLYKLRRLDERQTLDLEEICGFADDLAVGTLHLDCVFMTLNLIDDFRMFSGLGVNRSKTKILSTAKITPEMLSHMDVHCPWRDSTTGMPDIKLVEEAVYLGIPFARDMNPAMFYAKATQKFQARANQIGPIIKRLPLQRYSL